MLNTAQWWAVGAVVAVQFGLTLAALLCAALTARTFYLASTANVSGVTGLLIGAGSGWAALTGLVAAAFTVAATTEPDRRRRHTSLARQYLNMKARSRP